MNIFHSLRRKAWTGLRPGLTPDDHTLLQTVATKVKAQNCPERLCVLLRHSVPLAEHLWDELELESPYPIRASDLTTALADKRTQALTATPSGSSLFFFFEERSLILQERVLGKPEPWRVLRAGL